MKRWILIVVLAAGAGWLLADRLGGDGEAPTMDAAPPPAPRVLDPVDVIAYSEMSALTYRVRTTRDVLPGGLSAAMAPVFVVWDESDFSSGGAIMLRNLNHGGNPVSGITVLRTATVRPDLLERVELLMVPLGGPDAVSHGQLRFVFADGGAQLLGGDTSAVGEPEPLTDIVLSWEAWRAPGVDYSVMKGMDHEAYKLSMRGYSGVQRFLEDALQQREWNAYTLRLPGGPAGLAELLKVSLAMGDGVARHVLAGLLEQAEEDWAAAGPDAEHEGGDALSLWQELRTQLGEARTGGDERIDLAGHTGYQSLLRSCATMALYTVDLATSRLIEAGMPHAGMRPTQKPEIADEPAWMTELASASIAGVFLRGPRMIGFVLANPTTIPSRIPGALDEAGLLVRDGDQVVKRRYTIDTETPWGPAGDVLIR